MIFVGYEPGSKGYQFWDAAHQHFEISHDVKFEEMQFPARETLLAQPILAPSSDQTISSSDIDHNNLGLDLVKLAQPPTRPPSPGHSTQQTTAISSQPSIPLIHYWEHMGHLHTWRLHHMRDNHILYHDIHSD